MYPCFFTFISLHSLHTSLVSSGHYVFQLQQCWRGSPGQSRPPNSLLFGEVHSAVTAQLSYVCQEVACLGVGPISSVCWIVLPCVLSCNPQLLVNGVLCNRACLCSKRCVVSSELEYVQFYASGLACAPIHWGVEADNVLPLSSSYSISVYWAGWYLRTRHAVRLICKELCGRPLRRYFCYQDN